MNVLAIDPGNEQSAWCVLIDGVPLECGKDPNADLLDRLRFCATTQDQFHRAQLLAVEMIASYGMPVGKEVFDTCLWIGRMIEAWGRDYRLIYRREVKLYHCQSVRATDANIRAALIDRFGPGKEKAIGTKRAPGPLYGLHGDEWSALAIGLTAHASASENALHAMQRAA
jgi:hypothetical protein